MSSLKSFKLSQLAEILGAELEGDPSKEIFGINTLEESLDQEVSFIARESYLTKLSTTKAGAVICNTDYSELFTGNKLICENPYLTYARCTELFKEKPAIKTGIGTPEQTSEKVSALPVHGTLATWHPSSHATLAAWAMPLVGSSSLGLILGPLGYTIPKTGILYSNAEEVRDPADSIILYSISSPRLI